MVLASSPARPCFEPDAVSQPGERSVHASDCAEPAEHPGVHH